MRLAVVLVVLLLVGARADAQTWSDLKMVPRESSVRIFEKTGTLAEGKLLLVRDEELTIWRYRRALVIPKPLISKVVTRRRDSPIEGALIGAVANIGLGVSGGWQGCSDSKCATIGIPVWAALGALIDWSIREKRTVYRAP